MTTIHRGAGKLALLAILGNLIAAGCAVSPGDHAQDDLSATTNNCGDDALLKKKLGWRKETLLAKIDTAESKITVNDKAIKENSVTVDANTKFIKLLQEGMNYPPTDPAQDSAPGKKHLLDAIDDVGKFPATAVFKFGLYTLMAALEALTLRAGGKLIARKLCLQTAVRQAEKVAVAQATKLASQKALSMFGKFRSAFGRVRLVIRHSGAIGVPMKVKWDQKGDSWETWVPVIGTLKVGADNVGEEFSNWINADDVKKNLKEQVELIDAEIKKAQDEIKATAIDTATREEQNIQLTDEIKKMKTELKKVEAALAALGGNTCAPCADDGLVADEQDPLPPAPQPPSLTPVVQTDLVLTTRIGTGVGGTAPVKPSAEDYSTWSLDELLAGIDLSEGSGGDEVDALVRDSFEECTANDVCTPI